MGYNEFNPFKFRLIQGDGVVACLIPAELIDQAAIFVYIWRRHFGWQNESLPSTTTPTNTTTITTTTTPTTTINTSNNNNNNNKSKELIVSN